MSKFTVVYDACVLYPAPLRDLLLQLATTGLFRARWSDQIHEEWIGSLLRSRSDLTQAQFARTKNLMNAAVPDCLVDGYAYLIPSIELPDPDDRHVVAAAIHGRADAIVTFNKKDFPAIELEKHRPEAIHPDDFISYQLDLNPAAVVNSVRAIRQRLRNPPISADEHLNSLQAQSLTRTVNALRPYAPVI